MGKDVLVTIVGTQQYRDGEQDTITLVTKGSYHQKNNLYYILYKESEITGMEGTTTSIKAEAGRVVLNRMGTLEFRQVFEKNMLYQGVYMTTVGSMYIQVLPHKVEVVLDDSGGFINLEYDIHVDSEKLGYNKLSITIKEI